MYQLDRTYFSSKSNISILNNVLFLKYLQKHALGTTDFRVMQQTIDAAISSVS